jgi:uncharacterized OB-fold protein
LIALKQAKCPHLKRDPRGTCYECGHREWRAAMPEGRVPAYTVRNDVAKAGLTALGFSLGLRRLVKKEFIEVGQEPDPDGDEYRSVIRLLEKGWLYMG